MNLYGFAGGDPVHFNDPFGLCCFVGVPIPTTAWSATGAHAGLDEARHELVDAITNSPVLQMAREAAIGSVLGLEEVGEGGTVRAAYKRPSGATTAAQRAAVQGKACVKCGAAAERMVAGHKEALVKEWYETGQIDRTKMRSVDAVQPECASCSASEGGMMAQFSIAMKKLFGFK